MFYFIKPLTYIHLPTDIVMSMTSSSCSAMITTCSAMIPTCSVKIIILTEGRYCLMLEQCVSFHSNATVTVTQQCL